MPSISVIIPCYNRARFLGEAIESALAQNHPSLEIIVVDDGSTDNSADIAAQYPDVRCVRQRNAGVAVARNVGLSHSSGDYVVFLDSDDRLLPGALASNLQHLLDQPDCAFVFGDTRCIDINGEPLPQRSSSPHEGKQHYFSLLHGSYIWTQGMVMYKRAVLTAVGGFNPRLRAAEDLDLVLRIARHYPVYHNDTMVLEHRMHPGRLSYNYALVLSSIVTVLRRQKRWTSRDRRYRDALRHGVRSYENLFGEPLVTQIVANLHHRENWRQTWIGLLVILRFAPLLPARYARWWAKQLLSR